MKRGNDFRRDAWIYAVIGGLTAAQAYIASGDLPARWAPWVGIILAGLVAWKAKLSNGHPPRSEE